MGDDVSTAFAAPFTEQINGQTYTFSPLRFADWGVLEHWIRKGLLDVAREQAMLVDDVDHRRVIYDSAHAQISRMTIGLPGGQIPLLSPQGMLEVIYYSLARKHPDITRDNIEGLLDQVPDAFAIFDHVWRISNQAVGGSGGENNDPKVAALTVAAPGTT